VAAGGHGGGEEAAGHCGMRSRAWWLAVSPVNPEIQLLVERRSGGPQLLVQRASVAVGSGHGLRWRASAAAAARGVRPRRRLPCLRWGAALAVAASTTARGGGLRWRVSVGVAARGVRPRMSWPRRVSLAAPSVLVVAEASADALPPACGVRLSRAPSCAEHRHQPSLV